MCLENIQKLNFISPLLWWNLSFTSIDRPPNICRCVLCGDGISQKKVGGWENHAKNPLLWNGRNLWLWFCFWVHKISPAWAGAAGLPYSSAAGASDLLSAVTGAFFSNPVAFLSAALKTGLGLALSARAVAARAAKTATKNFIFVCVVWCDFTEKSRRLRKICEKRCYGKEYTLCTLSISFLKKRCAKRSSTCESSLVNCR